ncbi:6623_t:CDS:2, partial [Racocetra persica]
RKSSNIGAKISGIHVFGFNAMDVQQERERKQRQPCFLKSFNTLTIDQGLISQNAYRKLATIQSELPREYNVLNTKKRINKEMNIKIPIFTLNIDDVDMSLTTNEPSNDNI